jgi:hypothetical protein
MDLGVSHITDDGDGRIRLIGGRRLNKYSLGGFGVLLSMRVANAGRQNRNTLSLNMASNSSGSRISSTLIILLPLPWNLQSAALHAFFSL